MGIGGNGGRARSLEIAARVAGRPGRITASRVSEFGCRIATSAGFVEPGNTITLTFPGQIRVVGQVMWRDGRDADVKFRTPLHPALLSHLGFEDSGAPVPASRSRPAEPRGRACRSAVLSGRAEVLAFFG
jgi:hypothetical protein